MQVTNLYNRSTAENSTQIASLYFICISFDAVSKSNFLLHSEPAESTGIRKFIEPIRNFIQRSRKVTKKVQRSITPSTEINTDVSQHTDSGQSIEDR